MAPNRAAGEAKPIEADDIARIEITQDSATKVVQLRVVMKDFDRSYQLEFPDMDSAIDHYRRLWSQRTADSGDSDSSKSQTA